MLNCFSKSSAAQILSAAPTPFFLGGGGGDIETGALFV